jgi:predicted helicase
MIDYYRRRIYDLYKRLLPSKPIITDWDNHDLSKIFEYFSAIKLTEEFNRSFKEYNDLSPDFKEKNGLSHNDSGIDICDEKDTIVQCKLRSRTLTWNECSTFFASQNMYCDEQKKTIIRWENLFIVRNYSCKLSANLQVKRNLFRDITY